jgi:hypothetical protein
VGREVHDGRREEHVSDDVHDPVGGADVGDRDLGAVHRHAARGENDSSLWAMSTMSVPVNWGSVGSASSSFEHAANRTARGRISIRDGLRGSPRSEF